jgi:cytochrome bd-type quinol oxidase subunit 1
MSSSLSTAPVPALPASASILRTAELLLRNPVAVLAQVQAGGPELRELPLRLALCALAGFGLFGFLLGFTRSPLAGLAAAPKLMIVGLGSLAVCLPALHVYGRLLGARGSPLQSVCEALVALATTGLTLLGLCPVWLAFSNAVNHPPTGYFHVMLGSLAFLGLAALRGVWVLVRALRLQGRTVVHLLAWTALYGLVGIQMAWVVRPFVGTPGSPVVAFRPLESSGLDAASTLWRSNIESIHDNRHVREEGW